MDTNTEPVVAREHAEQEFERWADDMALDLDTALMDEDDKRGFEKQKRRIIGAMMAGKLTIAEDGTMGLKASTDKTIVFREPTGAAMMAMDRAKKGADVAKMHAVLAEVTKQNPSDFATLPMRDWHVCVAVVTLFLS